MIKGMTNAEYLRALRQRAVEQGKCYVCRKRPQKPGSRSCVECIARSDEAAKSFIARRMCINCCCNLPRGWTNQTCPGCGSAETERVKALKVSRAACGMCTECGKREPVPGHRRCLACNEEGRLRQLELERRRGRKPGINRCSVCTALGLPGLSHNKTTHARYMAAAAAWSSP